MQQRIFQLVTAGDLAAAFAESERLDQVCAEVEALFPTRAEIARACRQWAATDLAEARRLWVTLARDLRKACASGCEQLGAS